MVVFGDGGIGALEGCFVPSGEPFDTCPTACGMVCKDNFAPQGESFVTCPTACRSKGDETKGKRGNPKTVAKVRTSPRPQLVRSTYCFSRFS